MLSTKKGVPMLLAGEVFVIAAISVLLTEYDTSGLYDESGPPTEVADKINASFPNLFMVGLGYRSAKLIAEADK